jgi:hypothetical protein
MEPFNIVLVNYTVMSFIPYIYLIRFVNDPIPCANTLTDANAPYF